ncbi:hypothetical protein J6590_002051 [Homalodisca vitripennis]|nr:hypothetical protein J6590_002051 [Homalodisca vitripennis]
MSESNTFPSYRSSKSRLSTRSRTDTSDMRISTGTDDITPHHPPVRTYLDVRLLITSQQDEASPIYAKKNSQYDAHTFKEIDGSVWSSVVYSLVVAQHVRKPAVIKYHLPGLPLVASGHSETTARRVSPCRWLLKWRSDRFTSPQFRVESNTKQSAPHLIHQPTSLRLRVLATKPPPVRPGSGPGATYFLSHCMEIAAPPYTQRRAVHSNSALVCYLYSQPHFRFQIPYKHWLPELPGIVFSFMVLFKRMGSHNLPTRRSFIHIIVKGTFGVHVNIFLRPNNAKCHVSEGTHMAPSCGTRRKLVVTEDTDIEGTHQLIHDTVDP